MIGDRVPQGAVTDVAVGATVRSAALRVATADRAESPHAGASCEPLVRREDLRQAVREEKAGNLLILVVDASASMGVERRMGAVKGAVLSLLMDAYQRRDRVAVITFGGEDAEVVLRPTGSMEIARPVWPTWPREGGHHWRPVSSPLSSWRRTHRPVTSPF